MNLRRALKKAYLHVPLARPMFSAVRRVWTPPPSVYRYLCFRGAFPIDVRGRRLLMRHDGNWIENELFWRGLYGGFEAWSLRLWTELAARSQVVLDVGANTGIYALVAKTINPAARVYAFEPIERTWQKLLVNVHLNGYDVDCRLAAVSNYDGVGEMFDLDADNIYAVALDRDVHHGDVVKRKVEVVRLDTFLKQQNVQPDLIKVDVESREPEVLEGLGSVIEERRPSLLVEIWHDGEQDGELRLGNRVEQFVNGKGYRYFRVDEKSGPVAAEHIGMPGMGYSNYLLCTEERGREIGLS